MKKITSFLLCSLIPFFIFSQEIGIELFASGLNNPVSIKNANDDRLFVIEKSGTIKIIQANGTVNTTPFLDINDRVINTGNERGLLGMAFHPNFDANGFFYVNYSNNAGDNVISAFVVNPPNGDLADASTETILMTIDQPYSNHNGGDLAFGNDGYLYIASGDGGSGGDPQNRAQNLTTFLGKLLRIDVNNSSGGNNYAIPADNPFVGSTTALEEIWAYGLRNPWRFSFDRTTNDLWIADVGQNEIEEINMVGSSEAGINYGWRCYEGNDTYNTAGCPDESTLTFPVAQYSHSGNGPFKCSITGGYRYRGADFTAFSGLYFFADYCSNEIGTLSFNGSTWDMAFSEVFSGNGWTAFGEDSSGELYIAGGSSDTIYRIIDSSLSVDENSLESVKMFPNPADDLLTFKSNGSISRISEIKIYNLQGKLIKTVSEINNQNVQISIKDLAKGLYITEITASNGGKEMKKLIIK